MTPEEWIRVKRLFDEALARAPEDRAAFVTEECAGDAQLRAEVDRLLGAHAQAAAFIEPQYLSAPNGPPRPLMTGRTVGRYLVGRLVGAGGMGQVYAARDVELGRDVALKIGIEDDIEAQAQLRREAQNASQLNHPHICTIHEVGTCDGQAFIVMEHVEGHRLSELIPPEGLPIESALRYGIQLADALAHAHRSGVSHRDLKSSNVVVTPDGRAKILDFGLSRRLSAKSVKDLSDSHASITSDGMLAGTLSCMAPELLRGEPFDARSDIWSLGVLLYEMAAGAKPFAGTTGFEVSAAILHEQPAPLPARVSSSLDQMIRRCLAKDPRGRYQHAGEIRSALEAAQSETKDTRPIPVLPAVERFLPMGRATAVVAAVVTLLLVALALAWSWRQQSKSPAVTGVLGRPAIAVMNFENIGGAQSDDRRWMSSGVPRMLLTGLAQTRGLEIVSPQRLQDAVKQIGGTSLDALDKNQTAEVARRAGAGAIVVGSIFQTNAEIRIDAQLEDLATGRVLAAKSVRGGEVFGLVDQLAASIRASIVDLDSGGPVRGVAELSSSSLEAYRLYSEGVQAHINARWDDAHRLLERAVAIDPAFADAYLQLAFVDFFRGYPALRREYLRKAAEHAERLGERQRFLLEIETAREAGNADEAARTLDKLLAEFPDVEDAYGIASYIYEPMYGIHDSEKLLRITASGAARLTASHASHNVYGYTLLAAGRYREALSEFETYARLAPREPNPHDSLGEAFLVMGMPERAIESYSRALTIDPTFGSRNGLAWAHATLGRYDEAVLAKPTMPAVKALIFSRVGRYREAAESIEVGRRDVEQREDFAEQGGLLLLSSLLAIERTQYARAVQDSRAALDIVERLPQARKRSYRVIAALLSGLAEARQGKIDAARSHLEFQARNYKPELIVENWWHAELQGEMALARRDYGQATAVLSGQPLGKMWFYLIDSAMSILANNLLGRDALARSAKAQGDLSGAIGIYRGLLADGPQQRFLSVFEPRYVLEIARLLQQMGDKPGARTEYERFLNLWKDADGDLPELAEARRAVSRLR